MNNANDDIITEIMNSIPQIKKQLSALYDSVDKFKFKRHLIIYSYLLGYFVSKKFINFDKEKIENSVETFNKSIVKKEDFTSLILNIALSLNYYHELEKNKKYISKSNCCYSVANTEKPKLNNSTIFILNSENSNTFNTNNNKTGNLNNKKYSINNEAVNYRYTYNEPKKNMNNKFFSEKQIRVLNNFSNLSYSEGILENNNTVYDNTNYPAIFINGNDQNAKSTIINSINPSIKSPIINMKKCEICLDNFNICANSIYELQCKCVIHRKCFDQYIKDSIENKKIPILCPKCKSEIHPNVIYDSLTANNLNDLINKYEKLSMDWYVMNHKDEYFCCPTPGCNYIVSHGKNAMKFTCPLCKKKYCMLCKKIWHDNMNCEEYKNYLTRNNSLNNSNVIDKKNSKTAYYKTCPNCKLWIEEKEGYKKVRCVCGTIFCFKCGNIIPINVKECPYCLKK